MEFKEFAKLQVRMCVKNFACRECPMYAEFCNSEFWTANKCREASYLNPEKAEEIVRRWADEHPLVTNRQKFREVFGREIRQSAGVTRLAWISGITDNSGKTVNEWLNAEYEPPKESE